MSRQLRVRMATVGVARGSCVLALVAGAVGLGMGRHGLATAQELAPVRPAGAGGLLAATGPVEAVVPAAWTPPLLPQWWLYNTPLAAGLTVQRHTPSPTDGWAPVPGTTRPAPGIQCSLTVLAAATATGSGALRLSSQDFDNSAASGADGLVRFKPALAGPRGVTGTLLATCTLA